MARKNNAQRKDGRYAVQIYLGTVDGKRKYKTVYGYTQSEADEKANELKIAMNKGIDISANNDTFGFWSMHWLKSKETTVSPKRHLTLTSHQHHLKALNNSKLLKLTTSDIQLVINNLAKENPTTKKPSSADLLRSVRNAARQIFNLAISNRILDYNPVTAVSIAPMRINETRRALTKKEQGWIKSTEHDAKCAALIMLYAGLRRGELIALTWNDIDLKAKTISVNKSVQFIKNKAAIQEVTKQKGGNRVVYIPSILVDYLGTQPKSSIYVTCNAKKGIHTETSWRYLWSEYLDVIENLYAKKKQKNKADSNVRWLNTDVTEDKSNRKKRTRAKDRVINLTPHMLRHTYATNLYFAGVDVLTAQNQLGHTDIKTTLNIYTHLDDVHKKKNIDKYEKYLKSASHMQVK